MLKWIFMGCRASTGSVSWLCLTDYLQKGPLQNPSQGIKMEIATLFSAFVWWRHSPAESILIWDDGANSKLYLGPTLTPEVCKSK